MYLENAIIVALLLHAVTSLLLIEAHNIQGALVHKGPGLYSLLLVAVLTAERI